jgi:hypothetical protein
MIHQQFETQPPRAVAGPLRALALVALAVLAIVACTPTTSSPATSSSPAGTSNPSGAAACIDASTAAILTALTAPGANVETIITEQGDELVAGLESFTPPADATTWRDDLVAAIEDQDAEAVQEQVRMIGTSVTLEFC